MNFGEHHKFSDNFQQNHFVEAATMARYPSWIVDCSFVWFSNPDKGTLCQFRSLNAWVSWRQRDRIMNRSGGVSNSDTEEGNGWAPQIRATQSDCCCKRNTKNSVLLQQVGFVLIQSVFFIAKKEGGGELQVSIAAGPNESCIDRNKDLATKVRKAFSSFH